MNHRWLLAACALALASGTCIAQETSGAAQASKLDVDKAQQTATQVCAACHGPNGNSMIAANPSLAGQGADYIHLQLAHFKAGIRQNPVMMAIASSLSDDDMASLGVYFSQQQPKPVGARDGDLVKAGQKIYRGGNLTSGLPACASCHSPTGAGIPARFPRLGGQYADYTLAQLKAFKAGERGNDKEGKDSNGHVMVDIAAKLSERDMQALAEYTAGLH